MAENYYTTLGIPTDADEREIKRAYHRLARDLHPDKAENPEQAREFEEKFSQVSAAYNGLKDSEKRAEYDAKFNKGKKTPTAQVMSAGRSAPPPSSGGSSSGPGKPRAPMGLTPERAAIAQKAYSRGLACLKSGDFPKAVEFFTAAIKNNDAEAVYHAQMAMALMKSHKSGQRAIEAAQRAIDLEPYNVAFKINLAMIFEAIGIESNAQKVYEEILRWEPENQVVRGKLDALKNKKKGVFSSLLDKFKK